MGGPQGPRAVPPRSLPSSRRPLQVPLPPCPSLQGPQTEACPPRPPAPAPALRGPRSDAEAALASVSSAGLACGAGTRWPLCHEPPFITCRLSASFPSRVHAQAGAPGSGARAAGSGRGLRGCPGRASREERAGRKLGSGVRGRGMSADLRALHWTGAGALTSQASCGGGRGTRTPLSHAHTHAHSLLSDLPGVLHRTPAPSCPGEPPLASTSGAGGKGPRAQHLLQVAPWTGQWPCSLLSWCPHRALSRRRPGLQAPNTVAPDTARCEQPQAPPHPWTQVGLGVWSSLAILAPLGPPLSSSQ